MKIGEKIKTRRIELGLSLQDVADYVGVNKTCVFYWEKERTKKMSVEYISKLAKILKVTPDSLAFDEDELKPIQISDLSVTEIETEILKLIQKMSFEEKIKLYNKLSEEKK